MGKIKCWISANTLSQMIGPLCIYLLMGVLWQAGPIKAGAFVVGGILYLVNYLTIPANIVLLIILSVKTIRNEQLTVKRFTFIAIGALVSIGYIFVYLFFLKDAVHSILA